MIMPQHFLSAFILVPFIGFLLSLILPKRNENGIAWTVFYTVLLNFLGVVAYDVYWISRGSVVVDERDLLLYGSDHYEFFIDFYWDKISMIFFTVGSFLVLLVARYSQYYMHRESGYKRFFNTLLFFYLGYTITVLSGNIETLFIGWEFLGVSSFLLIAFYRDRYLPIKNAVKVFSIYRVGDVGVILAMWLSHHLWNENVTFSKFTDAVEVSHVLAEHSWMGVLIAIAILVTAAAKSAQFPFTSWLPRAMEGPTPSSAIFYGSLSVHLGVFLLLRTFPLWESQWSARWLIGVVGFITAIVAGGIARVQSSIKAQIAYGSAAQIGLIFIELACGWTNIALFHFAGNAFLRTYQLLVSPSSVSYHIREQFFNFEPTAKTIESYFPKRLASTFYILGMKEFFLDGALYRFFWHPFKVVGRKLDFLKGWVLVLIIGIMIALPMANYFLSLTFSMEVMHAISFCFALVAVMMVLKSFTERIHVLRAWWLVVANHMSVAIAISLNENYSMSHNWIYLSGIALGGLIGYVLLRVLKSKVGNIDLDRFHGYVKYYPKMSMAFFFCCLALSGFPITPTFIGEDLIFGHIHEDQVGLALLVSLSFILDGLALIRIFARVFLGPSVRSVYEASYRSS
jgi:NADH:ubiquinone oxidoreductase subunit 5 (subunit L)/multisubunit Na+/H+ antiporter MnhA subunit